jgi:hypothetical protein
MAYRVCQTCFWDAGAAYATSAGAGVAGRGVVCCCGNALAICPWSRAKYCSAYLMLKSTSSVVARVGVAPCCWCGCARDEDGRASCSCWATTALPVLRACILRSASMSCAEALSPSRLTSNTPEVVCSTSGTFAAEPVPARGWTAETEGLAGSDAGSGVVAWAVVALSPADCVLAMRSWILPRGGRQTIGGNRARRWTSTQQPPDGSALL